MSEVRNKRFLTSNIIFRYTAIYLNFFPSGLPIKILCAFIFSPIRFTRLTSPITPALITVTVSGEGTNSEALRCAVGEPA